MIGIILLMLLASLAASLDVTLLLTIRRYDKIWAFAAVILTAAAAFLLGALFI